MIPNQSLTSYPEFGNNATKIKPDDQKYAAGFQPSDVLPAEWFNWLLNRSSKGVTELGQGVASMEAEINNVLTAGSVTPDAGQTSQLLAAISYIINQVRLDEQQRPAVGVPTLWMGAKPSWALDFGNGATDQYLWANYPKLNNDKFKSVLTTLSNAGWMTAYNTTGFYVPDLRGIVPIGYGGPNAKRLVESTSGGSLGAYSRSSNLSHTHDFTHYHNRGSIDITGTFFAKGLTYPGPDIRRTGALYDAGDAPYSYDTQEDTDGKPNGIGIKASNDTNFTTKLTSVGRNAANTDNVTSTGSNGGSISKPPTIAVMWIVRFD